MTTLTSKLGAADANSYVSLAEAEAYVVNRPSTDWAAKTDDEKNQALIAACFWLETLTYQGDRCHPSTTDSGVPQALKWPRHNFECDGVEATCTMIPAEIKRAQIELALQYVTSPGLFPGQGSGGAPQGTFVSETTIGSLTVKYEQFNGTTVTSCDNCGDPAILMAFSWLSDLLGCWTGGGLRGGVGLIPRVRS